MSNYYELTTENVSGTTRFIMKKFSPRDPQVPSLIVAIHQQQHQLRLVPYSQRKLLEPDDNIWNSKSIEQPPNVGREPFVIVEISNRDNMDNYIRNRLGLAVEQVYVSYERGILTLSNRQFPGINIELYELLQEGVDFYPLSDPYLALAIILDTDVDIDVIDTVTYILSDEEKMKRLRTDSNISFETLMQEQTLQIQSGRREKYDKNVIGNRRLKLISGVIVEST